MKFLILREDEREAVVSLVVERRKLLHDGIDTALPDSFAMRAMLDERRVLGRVLGKLAWGKPS